eukprot:CAMPEP_0198226808 /NCGR_PEP_ID=MMETSP1445-20131203/106714_1 /TAXON_ID=36898 /ORGANISM="Pyramimonas sp., Strain CCMP2087" /LENGTH=113 /DNA_ID=CAMNT_0043906703 /DNA_START=45 /DNA_END=386 /DNA_ORIENTATION=+
MSATRLSQKTDGNGDWMGYRAALSTENTLAAMMAGEREGVSQAAALNAFLEEANRGNRKRSFDTVAHLSSSTSTPYGSYQSLASFFGDAETNSGTQACIPGGPAMSTSTAGLH